MLELTFPTYFSDWSAVAFPYARTAVVGDPAHAIVALAARKGVDVIVQGTRGRRLVAGLPLGSVASAVVRRARCAVLTIRGTRREVPLFEHAPARGGARGAAT